MSATWPAPFETEAGQSPDLSFAVSGSRMIPHAAAPMLELDLEIHESRGVEVYMIALTVQVMLEPARRTYDAETQARLIELFGPPERWSVTTRSLVWAKLDVVVAGFSGATSVGLPISCHYDLELAAAKYLHGLQDGVAPLALHFNGTVYYRHPARGLQLVLVPWTQSIGYRMPVSVWHETIDHYYPGTAWLAVRSETLAALQERKRADGLPTLDAALAALLDRSGHAAIGASCSQQGGRAGRPDASWPGQDTRPGWSVPSETGDA
jgi:hypothetical protein